MNTIMRKRLILFLKIFTILSSVSLFLPSSGMPQDIKKGGTAIVVLGDNPASLNCAVTFNIPTLVVSPSMFNSLIAFDFKGNILPELANSWDFSSDGKSWVFHLQKGVKWHDGKDFTSADVAFTIKEVIEKYHPMGEQAFGPVQSVETPDPHTAVFKFDKPHISTLSYLSYFFAPILPKHLYENTDILKNPYNLKPVGTGPYKFVEYKKGSHITVTKNPNYWRKGKPYLDKVIYQIIPDASARIVAFEKSEVDIIPPYYMALSEVARFKGIANADIYDTFMGPMYFVPINLNNKLLSDQKVRYALSHAVNRKEIIDKAFFGYGKVPVGPIPSSIPWAYTDDVLKFDYNPTKANQLLDQGGYKKGSDGIRFSLNMPYAATRTEIDRSVKMIQANLREVGIDVKLKTMEYIACLDQVFRKKEFDLSFWLAGLGPDPAIATARMYITSQIRATTGITNGMSYSNPEVDRLFIEGGTSRTRDAAGEKFKRIQKLIVEDLPCLWIIEPPYVLAYSSKLEGLPDSPYAGVAHLENVRWKK